MAKTVSQSISSGNFVPYHTEARGYPDGLVGYCSRDAEGIGDATGGALTLQVNARQGIFGFPWTWVPTVIAVQDNLAAAEVVAFTYVTTVNRLLGASLREAVTTVRSGTENMGVVQNVAVPIEPTLLTEGTIVVAVWPTNTDTKVYHLHMAGPVFDMQWLAKNGVISPMLAGLR